MEYNFGKLNKKSKNICERMYYKAMKNRTPAQAAKYIDTNYTGDNHKAIRWQMFEATSTEITISSMLYWFFIDLAKMIKNYVS